MMILKELRPDDPDYYKPLDELIEDLGHAEPGQIYGDVIVTVEDLTDALHYLKEYRKLDALDNIAFPEDDNPPLTDEEK